MDLMIYFQLLVPARLPETKKLEWQFRHTE